MTIRYVTPGAWGAGIGSPLPAAYVDENFYTLVQAVNAAVASISSSVVSVVSADVTGDQLTFTLSDSTVLGPFTLPTTEFTWRGAWTPSTAYALNDLFEAGGSIYQVIYAHTSDTSFNPGASTGGNPDYALWLTTPSNVIPLGGDTGEFLRKASATDFDTLWDTIGLIPTAGIAKQALTKNSNTTYDVKWDYVPLMNSDEGDNTPNGRLMWIAADSSWEAQTVGGKTAGKSGTSYTLGLADTDYVTPFLYFTNSAGCVITVPPAPSSVDWQWGTEFRLQQVGSLPITLVEGSGSVSITVPNGKSKSTSGRPGDVIVLKKLDTTNSWVAWGDLAGADANLPVALPGTSGAVNLDTTLAKVFTVVPSGNMTIAALNRQPGQEFTLIIITSGTSSWTITFGSGFVTTGTLATGTVTAKRFVMRFVADNSNCYEVSRTTAM